MIRKGSKVITPDGMTGTVVRITRRKMVVISVKLTPELRADFEARGATFLPEDTTFERTAPKHLVRMA